MGLQNRLGSSILSISLLATFPSYANLDINNSNFDSLLKNSSSLSDDFNRHEVVEELWKKYLSQTQSLEERKLEHQNKALKFQDKTMKFSLDKIGTPGKNGYPLYIALHGGGSAPESLNNSQWEHMKIYYKYSVDNGVYVATRGITNNWNLHFEDESYPLYEKLIENMVLFENVDPNRVYFLGFSAGGDGVYQVVPRMADRFAAANMSAGHHNWIKFDNLYNTPFLIQVGEYDSAYNRNKVAAQNYLELQNLHNTYGGGFVSDLFVHTGFSHNGWPDNDERRPLANVIANPKEWLDNNDRTTKQVNSNAVDWINNHTRNPVPRKIVWDLNTDAKLRNVNVGQEVLKSTHEDIKLATPHDLFYWLDVSVADSYPVDGKIVAEYIRENNTINIIEATNVNKLRVLVNDSMVINYDLPVVVMYQQQLIDKVNLKPNVATLTRTLLERSDKNYMFEADFVLEKDTNGAWKVLK